MRKCAMLLSGGINKDNNYIRYKNDLEWVYKILVEDCGYCKDAIDVYFANGAAILYDGKKVFTVVANKENVVAYLKAASETLGSSDELVIIVSNHGGSEKHGFINLWGVERLELDVFAQWLNKIKARKTVVLGECYAGNILRYNIKNGCILTANQEGFPSYANPPAYEYDEFILHFFSYIHGEYPDGTKLKENGCNDVRKAYEYAVNNDAFHPNSSIGKYIQSVTGKKYIEIPQMRCDVEGMIIL